MSTEYVVGWRVTWVGPRKENDPMEIFGVVLNVTSLEIVVKWDDFRDANHYDLDDHFCRYIQYIDDGDEIPL